jgi:hypothetical protein
MWAQNLADQLSSGTADWTATDARATRGSSIDSAVDDWPDPGGAPGRHHVPDRALWLARESIAPRLQFGIRGGFRQAAFHQDHAICGVNAVIRPPVRP